MCLILFAYNVHPCCRLLVLANRDEYYQRPARALGPWHSNGSILAGQDLKSGGTWMGLASNGRFAALTNYRDPSKLLYQAPSRGLLVTSYLEHEGSPDDFMTHLDRISHRYNGFNLLFGDRQALCYYSNVTSTGRRLARGVYGLSNHLLDTPWPKLVKGKKKLQLLLEGPCPEIDALFALLRDQTVAPDGQLPNTGVGLERERLLAPIFIRSPDYGTRCSSVVMIRHDGSATFWEHSFEPTSGTIAQARCFDLPAGP